LTAWVVLVIAVMSFAFSTFIYKTVSFEIERSFHEAEARVKSQAPLVAKRPILNFLSEDFEKAKRQVMLRLLVMNGVILVISAGAGYFLAGKALYPIERALVEQKRFVSDASHELRTPLTSLKTEMEVALRDKRLKIGDAKELVKSNLEEVAKLQELISYLLVCARYGDTSVKLPIKPVRIAKIVENAVRKVSSHAAQKQIKIKQEVQNGSLRANEAGLEELLVILLDNAVKYSLNGGEVVVSVKEDKKYVTFEVKDFGVGIAASDIPYIFNRFYRADSSRSKQKVDGYGLGLAIAKGITEAHKGEIKVKSKPGAGSTFKVILPKA